MMGKITLEMIVKAYSIGKQVYRKELSRLEGINELEAIGMNHSSAHDYVYSYYNLIQGKFFTRSTSAKALDYYLSKIHEEEGSLGLTKALRAVALHFDYCENQLGQKVIRRRKIYDKFFKLVKANSGKMTLADTILTASSLIQNLKYTVFKSDKEYFQWMNTNPDGYILNTTKGRRSNQYILHKSQCSHITKSKRFDDKAYTGNKTIKVGGHTIENLIVWCRWHRPNYKEGFKICSDCKPEWDEAYLPEELDIKERFIEGAVKRITVNAYERDYKARVKCLDHYGYSCQVCTFDFEDEFGSIGKEYIHVHHVVDLALIGKEYEVDPINDLVPVCPNCHAMLHKRKPAYSIEELKEIISNNK